MARKPANEQGDTLKEIQTAAFRLFGRYGYDGVSMQKVAQAAGLTKAALYWHYENKDQLYIDCLRRLLQIIRSHVYTDALNTGNPSDRVVSLFSGVENLMSDPQISAGVAGYWLDPSTSDLPEARKVITDFEAESTTILERLIQDGVDSSDFDPSIPVADMARAIHSIIETVVLPMRQQSPEEVRRHIGVLSVTFLRAYAKNISVPGNVLDFTQARAIGD